MGLATFTPLSAAIAARLLIDDALEGGEEGTRFLTLTLRRAEESILILTGSEYQLSYVDETNERRPITLDMISNQPASTTTTLLAWMAWSILIGKYVDPPSALSDLLNIIRFIREHYELSDEWPFSKEQIRSAWRELPANGLL